MKYSIEAWPLRKLIELYDSGQLDLNPPYQRNPVWAKKTQMELIQTIKDGAPIPNFFLFQKDDMKIEMVDGQQRSRSILLYYKTNEIDIGDDEQFKGNQFLDYEIAVITIKDVQEEGFIENYYFKVNSSGVKLNRPETLKAKFISTRFLKLVEEITNSDSFQKLDIFPSSSQKRMMDRDLVEELSSLVLYGITDKKLQVDKIYEKDITEEEFNVLKAKSFSILQVLNEFNELYPIRTTRYRQRNDFYTLFGFIKDNLELERQTLHQFYRILVCLGPVIRPSKFTSKYLSEYAFNCITQSNSSKARLARVEIINNILLNSENEPNDVQKDIKSFFKIQDPAFSKYNQYLSFNIDNLQNGINEYLKEEDED